MKIDLYAIFPDQPLDIFNQKIFALNYLEYLESQIVQNNKRFNAYKDSEIAGKIADELSKKSGLYTPIINFEIDEQFVEESDKPDQFIFTVTSINDIKLQPTVIAAFALNINAETPIKADDKSKEQKPRGGVQIKENQNQQNIAPNKKKIVFTRNELIAMSIIGVVTTALLWYLNAGVGVVSSINAYIALPAFIEFTLLMSTPVLWGIAIAVLLTKRSEVLSEVFPALIQNKEKSKSAELNKDDYGVSAQPSILHAHKAVPSDNQGIVLPIISQDQQPNRPKI